MLELKNVMDHVAQKATHSRPFTFDVVSLQAGKAVTSPDKVRITRLAPDKVDVVVINGVTHATAQVNLGVVYAIAGAISQTAFAKTQYGNVADDPMFHQLYDVQQRALPYIESGTLVHKMVASAPCMMCGLVLPLRNLTIDHQRPQAGGELEAILKTFRAFGLTREGPQGAKGKAILAHLRTGVPLTPVMPNLGRPALSGTSLNDRYSLTEEGTMLYSFVVAAGELEALKSQCMHGLLNLRPVCQTCNSARGNPLKF